MTMNKLVEDLCALLDMAQGLPAAYEILDACHMHEIIIVSTLVRKYVAIHNVVIHMYVYIGYIPFKLKFLMHKFYICVSIRLHIWIHTRTHTHTRTYDTDVKD